MASLFSPISLAGCELANRIVVSPMSQYSAVDGMPTEWHATHYGALSNSGAGLLIFESTHISEESRGTLGCLGIYTDEQAKRLGEIVETCKRLGSAKIGIQLNHSGRKASGTLPWVGRGPLGAESGGWETVSASAIPFGKDWPAPRAASGQELSQTKAAYVAAARRALHAGFDLLEIHAAHGYFLHAFLTPLANERTDDYGGDAERRMRFPLEVFEAVRAVWPKNKPLGAKVSSSDWSDKGLGIEDAIKFVKRLKKLGCDYVVMSSGAATAEIVVPVKPGYQTQFAEAVKKSVDGIPVCALGLIVSPREANEIVETGKADMVAIARGFLDNPHWAWNAANRLGAEVKRPNPYLRAAPKFWPGATMTS